MCTSVDFGAVCKASRWQCLQPRVITEPSNCSISELLTEPCNGHSRSKKRTRGCLQKLEIRATRHLQIHLLRMVRQTVKGWAGAGTSRHKYVLPPLTVQPGGRIRNVAPAVLGPVLGNTVAAQGGDQRLMQNIVRSQLRPSFGSVLATLLLRVPAFMGGAIDSVLRTASASADHGDVQGQHRLP